ncbi:hypothetical protein FHT86_002141 [Rhizobium sp. BK313]|uniref:hypothetical protein n=1 Tax=Rhizobium sp. BK313 TaxID=2587081 RepID=UPI00160D5E76|nr:hypothetical protein [Rhizobium sp. BK313]MBB3453885.1 hypothetical protein [Rhizobium sp. BK313]
MATSVIQSSFTTGEVSPSLFGHVDLARTHSGASTMRNMFVGYRGGSYSRAGTAFVGFSKQTGRAFPPRLIPFQFNINQGLALEFGNFYMRVISNGAYVVEPSKAIVGITQASPAVLTVASVGYATGDWVSLSGIGGMTQLNGDIVVLTELNATTFALSDAYGNPIDTTAAPAFTGGGAAARIFTLATIYSEADLEYLKFTQSADVMSLCCVNQQTLVEYPPQELTRLADDNWTLTALDTSPNISPPSGTPTITIVGGDGTNTFYEYVVTAISPEDGSESIASNIGTLGPVGDIATSAGSVTITYSYVPSVTEYNVYKASPRFGDFPPLGSLFGFAGRSFGLSFTDSNILPDFTQVPPTHKNPFARGQIIGLNLTSGGSGYDAAGAVINTTTGSGAIIETITQGGVVTGFIVVQAGEGYLPTDTVTIVPNTTGSGATATLIVGPETGTFPAVVAYFQERRVYAYTLNQPDTYFMSQPGSFRNFDSRIPTIPNDAIIGTPWSVEVNGIQFMISMPGGLVVLTGLSAWQLTGAGGSSLNPQPITPSNQQAQPQAYNGCSATVPPIKIDYDVIYVQAKGSIYRDLSYNFFTNIYTGEDLTQNSSQLFTGFTIREHAWCEEPYKILWSVRNDGVLLSLTYNKPQEVAGWSRHDTYGLYKTVCSVTEPPVDALYVGVQRFIAGKTAYMIERMNDRIWNAIEDTWCVDCGLSLTQPTPNATLTSSSATGLGAISGVTGLIGGEGYSPATVATVVDDDGNGPGSGAVVNLTITNGVIVGAAVASAGSGYVYPALVISDPANSGSGASATLLLDNSATFTASAGIFSSGNVGNVIRIGGGIATIKTFVSATQVVADISTPITVLLPNSNGQIQPQTAGNWTLTAPTTTLGGLTHLAGATVTGIADGNVIPPTVVPANGIVTLPEAATSATVGLGYQAQLQSLYLDVGQPTVQGQRKKIGDVTARVEASQGMVIGSNQPDGSTQSPARIATTWSQMADVIPPPSAPKRPYNSTTKPLFTGDIRIPVSGGFQTPGQVAIQQDFPLPMNVLAFIPEVLGGDTPETQAAPRQRQGGR